MHCTDDQYIVALKTTWMVEVGFDLKLHYSILEHQGAKLML